MKKIIASVLVIIIMTIIVVFALSNKEKKAMMIHNKNVIKQCNEKMSEDKILCREYVGGLYWFKNQKYIKHNPSNIFNELEASELCYNKITNADVKSFPLVFKDYIILVEAYSIKIMYQGKIYEKKYSISDHKYFTQMTFPSFQKDTISFFVVIEEKENRKRKYYVEEITFKNLSIKNNFICELEISDNLSVYNRGIEVSFFIIKNNRINLILSDSHYSCIYEFSLSGKLLTKGKSAEIFIPNNYDDSIYYIVDNSPNDKRFFKDNFSLIKDGSKIMAIDFSPVYACFYDIENIYFISDYKEDLKDERIPGYPFRPRHVAHFYNMRNGQFDAMFFRYNWNKSDALTNFLVGESHILIIPYYKNNFHECKHTNVH